MVVTCNPAGYPNADIVLHVREGNPKDPKAPNGCATAGSFAWAKGCDYDPITLRPTVGQVTICPGMFSQTEGEVKATMHHEVLHALVGAYPSGTAVLNSLRIAVAVVALVAVVLFNKTTIG